MAPLLDMGLDFPILRTSLSHKKKKTASPLASPDSPTYRQKQLEHLDTLLQELCTKLDLPSPKGVQDQAQIGPRPGVDFTKLFLT